MRIITDNKNNPAQEIKDHLLKRKHLEKITDYSLTKIFKPRKSKVMTKSYYLLWYLNPNHHFSFDIFEN